ncbi:MAG: hypothetical protein ABUS54_01495 [Actinomycetota bacterium]
MRSFALPLLVASLVALGVASAGSARPQTTAPGGYLTVRVTVTDKGVTMTPKRARRGQTAIFILSNHATASRVFTLGDVTLTHHHGTGFAVKLARNASKRVLLYLDYRGPLPSAVGTTAKTKVVGFFFVT